MYHFAGLDVSVKETSICIVDETGRIVLEVKVASELEALLQVLGSPIYRFKRIGLEAGPPSQWLFSARIKELVENLPDLAILVEPLLTVRRVLREHFSILHPPFLALLRDDDL